MFKNQWDYTFGKVERPKIERKRLINLTVPNQSLSIKAIYDRYKIDGYVPPVKKQVYFDTDQFKENAENIEPLPKGYDHFDAHEDMKNIDNRIKGEKAEKLAEKERKEKEEKEKAAKETEKETDTEKVEKKE